MSLTIKDVAADAGVSTATVSHVINKTRRVSKELRDRVNDSIVRLKYYPNHLVRGLRSQNSKTVGVVLPSISNEIFAMLTECIQKILFDIDYNIILCNTSYDSKLEDKALETLIMKKTDAISIIPVGEYTERMNEIREMGIPVIFIDRQFKDLKVDTIRVNNFKGEYDIICYLIKMGHRRIGYIDRSIEQSHSIEQRNGYVEALKDNGIEYDPALVINANGFDFVSGADAVKQLMIRNSDITAISAYYDILAVGAIRGLNDLGYSVPEDVSVVGYDGMKFTSVTSPRLTTVMMPIEDMARSICDLVVKRLEEKYADPEERPEFEPVDIVINPKLVMQESVKTVQSGITFRAN